MQVYLKLMNDRNVIKTVNVEDLQEAWEEIVDSILEHVEDYPCGPYDVGQTEWKWDRYDARKAKRLVACQNTITDFCIVDALTGKTKFSIVWHEVH